MTLTARREPTFDGAARNSSHEAISSEAMLHGAAGHGMAHAALPKPTGILRLVSTVQIMGSLLAVPLGLASGYSIYKANFAPETTCQQLRGNIISMLDKSVDATTRRMLVRRDVEAFEQNCGSFDPDAHAAFKRLLAADLRVAAPVAAPQAKAEPKPNVKVVKAQAKPEAKPKLKVERVEAKVEAKPERKVEAKVEPKSEPMTEPKTEPKVEAKVEPKTEPKVEAKVEAKVEPKLDPKPEAKSEAKLETSAEPQAETVLSDTRWVAAVRQALVKHPVVEEPELLQPSWTVTPAAAPPLPQAQTIPQAGPQMAAPPTDGLPVPLVDHPVPPGSIPEPFPVQARVHEHERSRLGEMISEIPVVGRMMRRGE
jgi:hypothetical protein